MDKVKHTEGFDSKSCLEKGKELFQKKDYHLALEQYCKVLDVAPEDREALFEMGKTYYVLENYPLAIKLLKKVRELQPDNIEACILLAKAYKSAGEYDAAIEELIKLKESGCYTSEIERELTFIYQSYSHLVQLCNFRGNYEMARKKANSALNSISQDNAFFRNRLLNELEIAERKTILSSKIRRLTVTLSNRCNLSCIMCITHNVPWEIPKRTIKEIFSLFPYLEKVMWQGGEVFVLDYFEEILSYAYQFPNLRQSIVTNGQLITEKMAEQLVKNNAELTFSIDGITKDTYEYIRRKAKFDRLIRNIKLISELKKQYKSNTILNLNVAVMKSNYHQLEGFIDFAQEFGFEFICLMPIHIHLKTPEDIFTNQDMEALRFITEVSPKIEAKAKQYGIRLENRLSRLTEINLTEPDTNKILNRGGEKKLLCHIPWQQLLIDYDGTVRPDCLCRIEKSAGSLLENSSLEEIWNNKVMQEYRKRIVDNDYVDLCNPMCISGKITESHLKLP